jgi:hypothetical protein
VECASGDVRDDELVVGKVEPTFVGAPVDLGAARATVRHRRRDRSFNNPFFGPYRSRIARSSITRDQFYATIPISREP